MVPFICESSEEDSSTLRATVHRVEPDSGSDVGGGGGGGGGPLRVPSIYSTGNGSNGTASTNIGMQGYRH